MQDSIKSRRGRKYSGWVLEDQDKVESGLQRLTSRTCNGKEEKAQLKVRAVGNIAGSMQNDYLTECPEWDQVVFLKRRCVWNTHNEKIWHLFLSGSSTDGSNGIVRER